MDQSPVKNYPASQWTLLYNHVISGRQPFNDNMKEMPIIVVRAQKMTNSTGYSNVLIDFTEFAGYFRKNFVYLKPYEFRYLVDHLDYWRMVFE